MTVLQFVLAICTAAGTNQSADVVTKSQAECFAFYTQCMRGTDGVYTIEDFERCTIRRNQ